MSGLVIGEGGGAQGWVQYWTLVYTGEYDESQYKQHLEGVITEIKLNTGGLFTDDDWNIFVDPDSPFSGLLTNSKGNDNEDGLIELEVKSPGFRYLNLQDKFPEETWIQAYGWWVEDHGHSAKTELHPLIYMISGLLDSYRFKIFMCPDTSGRFVTEAWTMYESFRIPLHGPRNLIYLGSQTNVVLPSEIVEETAIVDDTRKSRGSDDAYVMSQWEAGRTIARAHLSQGILHLSIDMGINGDVGPLYFADFQRTMAQDLNLQITKSISTGPAPNFHKMLQYRVKATLDDPASEPLAYSKWVYEESTVFGYNMQTTSTITSGSHEVEQVILYCPGQGLNDTSWELEVMGSTKPADWSPGQRTHAAQTGLGNEETRKFVHARALLRITPSRVSIKTEEISDSSSDVVAPDDLLPNEDISCMTGYSVTLTENLMPGVSGTPGWRVTVVAGQNGTALTLPDVREITSTWNGGVGIGYGIEIKWVNDHQINVYFERTGGSVIRFGGQLLITDPNQTRVVVTGYVNTELGEMPEASTDELYLKGCSANRPPGEFFLDIVKITIALAKMRDMGLLMHPWPPPRLLATWPPKEYDGTEEVKSLLRNPPKNAVKILETLVAFGAGKPVSSRDLKSLARAAERGSMLPDLQAYRGSLPSRLPRKIDHDPTQTKSPQVLIPGQRFLIERIRFRGYTTAFSRGSKAIILDWVSIMKKNPDVKLLIASYMDNTMSSKDSRKLTRKRADAIKRILVSGGIDSNRISTIGYGERDPRTSNRTAAGKRLNQRIEFQPR